MSGISVNRVANIVCQILAYCCGSFGWFGFCCRMSGIHWKKSKYIVNVVDLIVWCVLDWLDYVEGETRV